MSSTAVTATLKGATDSRGPTGSGQQASSYLKSYPYLFVRETDQTDYFCTLCDSYLKEEELQGHLFDGHQAENIEDFFVRVTESTSCNNVFSRRSASLYICVVCWAKIVNLPAAFSHRKNCKVDPSDEDLENGAVPMGKTNFVSCTPDITNILNSAPLGDDPIRNGLGVETSDHQPVTKKRKRQQPMNPPLPVQPSPAQCMQCTLCSMVIPTADLGGHLYGFHKISCSLEHLTCPLCFGDVSAMDLSLHLSQAHNVAQHAASYGILLWVLTMDRKLTKKSDAVVVDATPSKLNRLLTSPFRTMHPVSIDATEGNSQAQIPTVLQNLLSKSGTSDTVNSSSSGGISSNPSSNGNFNNSASLRQSNLAAVENIVSKFTRCHVLADGRESIQCLICSKWFAIPPVKHLRGHMVTFKDEKRRIVPLIGGCFVCIICYDVFENVASANSHLFHRHEILDASLPSSEDVPTLLDNRENNMDDTKSTEKTKVELDNAGRVKSGKVRKQCELCGEWSNIKWFFKHMSEVHQALFCRCCREYLPIHEHEEHKRWHSEPPYMGQKIRIESGQPVIIDRKERASLTPIGSLASWGGSSGGKVVKAVDTPSNQATSRSSKRKRTAGSPASNITMSPTNGGENGASESVGSNTKDTLMPKETCPVCSISITYKNLARHIKLRHKIKHKFCHKCRKLVPSSTYSEHRTMCNDQPVDEAGEEVTDLDEDSAHSRELTGHDVIIDPTEFLEEASGSPLLEADEDDNSERAEPAKKSDEVSTNNNGSKRKLDKLLWKGSKHAKRRCPICGDSIFVGSFKRHVRTAHPDKYQEFEKSGDLKTGLESVANPPEDEESQLQEHPIDEGDASNDDVDPNDIEQNHDREDERTAGDGQRVDRSAETDLASGPECQEKFDDADQVIAHCQDRHGLKFKRCNACSKLVDEGDFGGHTKEHEPLLDSTGNDDDGDADDTRRSRIFYCSDCNHKFLSESKYTDHAQQARHDGKVQGPATNPGENGADSTAAAAATATE